MNAYKALDDRLARQDFVAGDTFTVADAYAWTTMWHQRSGVDTKRPENLMAWKARLDARSSVVKALKDGADVVNRHKTRWRPAARIAERSEVVLPDPDQSRSSDTSA